MVEILKSMLGSDSEDKIWSRTFDGLRKVLELNPRVRCAFGNYFRVHPINIPAALFWYLKMQDECMHVCNILHMPVYSACMFMYSPSCGPPYLFFHLLPAEDLCLFIVNFDSNLRECKKMVNKILWCYWIPILNWLTSDFQFVNLLILKPFNVDLGLGFEIDWYEYQKKTSP